MFSLKNGDFTYFLRKLGVCIDAVYLFPIAQMARTRITARKPIFKRPGYRNYSRHKSQLESLFSDTFPKYSDSLVNIWRLSAALGVPKATIYRWKDKWTKNPEWRPWKSDKRLQNRTFSDSEEQCISDYIMKNYIEAGILFTNQDFKQIAIDAWLEKHKDKKHPVPQFEASDGFVTGFKQRNGFATRRVHQKRRTRTDVQYVDEFVARLRHLLATQDRERIINADETFWSVVPGDLRTWGRKGEQNIQFHANGSDKDGVTVVAAITAASTKLPLHIIASGKTERCEAQLGDTGPHLKAHSKKGWSTTKTFQLMSISERFPDDEPVWLVLDCYSAHRNEASRTLAASLKIELIFIPAGFTDELQPLDRCVFGVLKSYLRRLWRERFAQDPEAKFTKAVAVELLIPAWERLSVELIGDSWSIFEEE